MTEVKGIKGEQPQNDNKMQVINVVILTTNYKFVGVIAGGSSSLLGLPFNRLFREICGFAMDEIFTSWLC